jgi:toxic protein SymE
MPRSKSSVRPAPAPVRRESTPRRQAVRDDAPLQTAGLRSEIFSPPPLKPASQSSIPRFRTPTRCTMSSVYYEGWRGEQQVSYQVPKLRLSGRWLEACGFAIGDDLQVTVARGMLLISRRREASKD